MSQIPQPEQNQIDDWQSQWNATKAEYDTEIAFLQKTFDDKTQEFINLQSDTQNWLKTQMEERIQLRLEVARVRDELQQIKDEKERARVQFLGVNPLAEHYVQF